MKKRKYRVRQGCTICYSDGKDYPPGSIIYLTADEVNLEFWRDVEIPDRRHRQDLEMKVNEEHKNMRRGALMKMARDKGISLEVVKEYLEEH